MFGSAFAEEPVDCSEGFVMGLKHEFIFLCAHQTLCWILRLAQSSGEKIWTAAIDSGTDALGFWSINFTAFLTHTRG